MVRSKIRVASPTAGVDRAPACAVPATRRATCSTISAVSPTERVDSPTDGDVSSTDGDASIKICVASAKAGVISTTGGVISTTGGAVSLTHRAISTKKRARHSVDQSTRRKTKRGSRMIRVPRLVFLLGAGTEGRNSTLDPHPSTLLMPCDPGSRGTAGSPARCSAPGGSHPCHKRRP